MLRRPLLARLFTDAGYARVQEMSTWATPVSLTLIGLAADFSQLFGEVVFTLLWLSAVATVVFGVAVLLRTRFCVTCAKPLVVAVLATLWFGGIFGGQQLLAASKQGVLAKLFPQASEIQLAIYARLEDIGVLAKKIDRTTEQTAADVKRLHDKQDSLEKKFDALAAQIVRSKLNESTVPASPSAREGAEKAVGEAIADVAKGQDSASKQAFEALQRGDTSVAERLFAKVLEEKTKEGRAANREAAEAARNLAAFKRLTDVAAARDLYERAASLDPDHLWTWIDLGDMRLASGQTGAALEAYGKAEAAARRSGDERDLSVSHNRIGDVRRAQGDL
ncbi:MAG TPA: hypothetical protein PK812_13265, partial [Beijerinckiaceae bacterium]|nr:hypothetical protein [Beijerinckiaceae bacterium]